MIAYLVTVEGMGMSLFLDSIGGAIMKSLSVRTRDKLREIKQTNI